MNANGFFEGIPSQNTELNKAVAYYRNNPNAFIRDQESNQMYQSAIQLALENGDFEENDRMSHSAILGRTENANVVTSSNVGDITSHLRGPNESHSHRKTVKVFGDVVTMIRVPYSRINGLYFTERYPGSRKSPFMGDGENEITADTHGLTAFVCGVIQRGGGSTKRFRDAFLRMEKRIKKTP